MVIIADEECWMLDVDHLWAGRVSPALMHGLKAVSVSSVDQRLVLQLALDVGACFSRI